MKFRACVFAGLMMASAAACAQSAGESRWSITPYLWATDTTFDLTLRDQNIGGGSIGFSDLLDRTDSSFQINIEGGQGNWSTLLDFTYLDTSDTTQRAVLTIDSRSEQTFADAAVAWWPAGVGSNFNVYGGIRYTGFDDRYRFSAGDVLLSERKSSDDYYDALLGVRYRFDLSARWALLTRADCSFGDSEGTWLAQGLFAYTVGKRQLNRVMLGYQFKKAEFRSGDLATDYVYKGPLAGFNFRF